MGIIIAKFRKKKSTYEVLEKLENDITAIEEFARATENTKRKIVGRFIVLSLLTYVCLLAGLYFYYHKIDSNQKLIYVCPVIAAPIVLYVIKKCLTWYYSRKIRKNQMKLVKLKQEKKKILEKVEETETYKVAKQILDKFGDTNKKPSLTLSESTPSIVSKGPSIASTTVKPLLPALRQRAIGPPTLKGRLSFGQDQNQPSPAISSNMARVATPFGRTPGLQLRTGFAVPGTPGMASNMQTASAVQLPRPILPKNRTILDRMFEYLVGDGPSNRYALICKSCYGHNGMAYQEEFEYLSFKCYYCGFFNPSRKKRPSGPKFEPNTSPSRIVTTHSSDSDVSSDSGGDSKPIITELRSDSPGTTEKSSDFEKLSDSEVKEAADNAMSADVRSQTKDSGFSQTDPKNSADSSAKEYDDGKNPFSNNDHVDEGEKQQAEREKNNPFDSDDSIGVISACPMEVESFDAVESVPQESGIMKETKED